MSFGPCLRARRQRAASISSAVESGPPETASTRTGAWARGPNSVFASAGETGAASSAADTLLFPLDALLQARRCAGKLARDLAERRAGRFLLAERGERLPEAEQRVGRPGIGLELGRDVEESFRRVAEALALEQALAEPIGGVARHLVARMFLQEGAKAVLRQRVVLAQHIAVGEVVFVFRRLRGRQRRDRSASGARIARRRLAGRRHGGKIERRAGRAAAGRTDRRILRVDADPRGCRAGGHRAERSRRTRRGGMLRGIECIAAPSRRGGAGGWRRRGRGLRTRWRGPRRALLLHTSHVLLELLIAELQLLDRAGELPDLGLEALEAQRQVGAGRRGGTVLSRLAGRLRRAFGAAEAFAAAEQAVEQAARRSFRLLREGGRHHRRHREGEREYPDCTKEKRGHARYGLAGNPAIRTIRIPASKL